MWFSSQIETESVKKGWMMEGTNIQWSMLFFLKFPSNVNSEWRTSPNYLDVSLEWKREENVGLFLFFIYL